MNIYLAKKNGKIVSHTDPDALKQLYGIASPDKIVTEEEWEMAGYAAHIDASGEIVLGESEEALARREEIEALFIEEIALQSELTRKDYKVIKASETGRVLADTDSELHERREWCRNRINEIRARLTELGAGASAV